MFSFAFQDLDSQLNMLASTRALQGLEVHGTHVSRFSELLGASGLAGSSAWAGEWAGISSIQERIKHAQRSKRLTPAEVKEMLLPAAAVGANETRLPVREVCDVLEVDLGVNTSEVDEQELIRAYGRGDGQIDVQALLEDIGLWPALNIKALTVVPPSPPRPAATTRVAWGASDTKSWTPSQPPSFVQTAPARAQNANTSGSSAGAWELYHTTAVDNLTPPPPVPPASSATPDKREPTVPIEEQQPSSGIPPAAAATPLLTDPPLETPVARKPEAIAPSSHSVHTVEPAGINMTSLTAPNGVPHNASDKPEPVVPASNFDNGNVAESHQLRPGSQRTASPVAIQTELPPADDLVRQLKAENERLKRELMSFDLNFFEELEDLKFENQRYDVFTDDSLTTAKLELC